MAADVGIRFVGALADEHRVPALAATEAIGGIALAMHRAAFLVARHEARFKGPYASEVQIDLGPPEPGSVWFPLFLDISNGLPKAAIRAASKYLFSEATGRGGGKLPKIIRDIPTGTTAAAVESVEKPLQRSHNIIVNEGVNIILELGDQGQAKFDHETAEYLRQTNYDDTLEYRVASISSMRANDRSGRAFIVDMGKNITFKLSDSISAKSVEVLMSSFRRYFSNFGNDKIRIAFTSMKASDDKIKWVLIESASEISDES